MCYIRYLLSKKINFVLISTSSKSLPVATAYSLIVLMYSFNRAVTLRGSFTGSKTGEDGYDPNQLMISLTSRRLSTHNCQVYIDCISLIKRNKYINFSNHKSHD